MLALLRLIFGLVLGYLLWLVVRNAKEDPMSGDIANAGLLSVCVLAAIANAIVWAPYLGRKVAEAMTGSMTNSNYVERKNYLLQLIYWLQGRGHRRLTRYFCFLEGIHNPKLPAAFVIGMKNSKPGTWLEKIFAKEVFRFDNAQNCISAYHILAKRGIDPRPHRNPHVTLALQSLDREDRPEREILKVPKAEDPPLTRNPHIQLFEKPTEDPQPPGK